MVESKQIWATLLEQQIAKSTETRTLCVIGEAQVGKRTAVSTAFGCRTFPYAFVTLDQDGASGSDATGNLLEVFVDDGSVTCSRMSKLPQIVALMLDFSRIGDCIIDLGRALRRLNSIFPAKDAPVDDCPGRKQFPFHLLIVGTKFHEMEKSFGEDALDYYQQILRFICYQVSASLIFVTRFREETMVALKKYVLDLVQTDGRSEFKTNVVDRDNIFIPNGWDSLGKISVTKSFDPDRYIISLDKEDVWDSILSELRSKKLLSSVSLVPTGDRGEVDLDVQDEQLFLSKYAPLMDVKDMNGPKLEYQASVQSPSPNQSSTKPSPDGSTQNQVLANFFQSLLSKKTPSSNTRGEVEAELDKLKK